VDDFISVGRPMSAAYPKLYDIWNDNKASYDVPLEGAFCGFLRNISRHPRLGIEFPTTGYAIAGTTERARKRTIERRMMIVQERALLMLQVKRGKKVAISKMHVVSGKNQLSLGSRCSDWRYNSRTHGWQCDIII